MTSAPRSTARLTAVGLVVFLISGCSEDPSADNTELAPVQSPPGLESLDPPVIEQYSDYRADLDLIIADPRSSAGELAEAYGHLGMWNHAYTFFGVALKCYNNAAHLDSSDPRWPYYSAHVHLAKGRLENARVDFERVLILRPHDLPTLVHLGETEVLLGDAHHARIHLREALALDHSCVRAQVALGKLAFTEGAFAEAVTLLERALAAQPDAASARYTLAQALREIGEIEAAEAHLEALPPDLDGAPPLRLRDPNWEALLHVQRGTQRYMKIGAKAHHEDDFERAIQAFQAALKVDPDHPTATRNLAMSLQASGRWDEAAATYHQALRNDPKDIKALIGLGTVKGAQGFFTEAESWFEAALEVDPDSVIAHRNLAKLYRIQGRLEPALKHSENVCELDPALTRARFWRAATLIMLDRHTEARAHLEEDVVELVNDPSLALLLARVLSGSHDRGLRDEPRALELASAGTDGPMGVFEAETLAMVHAAVGNSEIAVRWQERVSETLEAAGRPAASRTARDRLRTYRLGEPSRRPWVPSDTPDRIPLVPIS